MSDFLSGLLSALCICDIITLYIVCHINVSQGVILILILQKELLTPKVRLKLKGLLVSETFSSSPWQDFACCCTCPSRLFGAGTFEFLGCYMNGWDRFSILIFPTVQKPDLEFRVVINSTTKTQFTAFPNLLLLLRFVKCWNMKMFVL